MTDFTNRTDNHHGIIGYLSLHDVANEVCLGAEDVCLKDPT